MTNLQPQSLAAACRNLKPYLVVNPAYINDKRCLPYTFNLDQLVNDIKTALGAESLNALQRYMLDNNLTEPMMQRSEYHATYNRDGVDLAKLRAHYKLRRNANIRGGLIVGQCSYADIAYLTSTTDYHTDEKQWKTNIDDPETYTDMIADSITTTVTTKTTTTTKTNGKNPSAEPQTTVTTTTNTNVDKQINYKHHVAALIYILVKQGTLIVRNLEHPSNAALLVKIHQQAPALYKFLTTDHTLAPVPPNTSTSMTAEEQLSSAEALKQATKAWTIVASQQSIMSAGYVDMYKAAPGERASTCKHPSVALVPDDTTYLNAWYTYINKAEFEAIAEPLNILLQYLGEVSADYSLHQDTQVPNAAGSTVINTTITFSLNQALIPASRRLNPAPMNAPQIFGNALNSSLGLHTVNLLRVLLATTINRPDLWAGWRGGYDKRTYYSAKGVSTRGARNKAVAWCVDRLEEEFNLNTSLDLNPWTLHTISLSMLQADPQIKRPKDATPYEQLTSADGYDVERGSWIGKNTTLED